MAEARAEVERWRGLAEQRGIDLARAEERAAAAERVAEAEIAAKAAEVAAKDTLVGELKAMPAEARKPFWRRWIGG